MQLEPISPNRHLPGLGSSPHDRTQINTRLGLPRTRMNLCLPLDTCTPRWAPCLCSVARTADRRSLALHRRSFKGAMRCAIFRSDCYFDRFSGADRYSDQPARHCDAGWIGDNTQARGGGRAAWFGHACRLQRRTCAWRADHGAVGFARLSLLPDWRQHYCRGDCQNCANGDNHRHRRDLQRDPAATRATEPLRLAQSHKIRRIGLKDVSADGDVGGMPSAPRP